MCVLARESSEALKRLLWQSPLFVYDRTDYVKYRFTPMVENKIEAVAGKEMGEIRPECPL